MDPILQKAKAIFVSLVDEVPDEEWERRADQACQGDETLRQRVRALLLAHAEPDRRIDQLVLELPDWIDVGGTVTEQPGTKIGPYMLVKPIGEGGFGVVFLAEQDRPVKRRVALKVIKPGMGTRQVIARFEAERQALAMMDHPNIAKVFETGTTETGRPYFVMELVQGVPITEYCDQCNLTTRERLELFITVCHAVQHAHQKGVIHRDIKPTNVLVAMQDGRPTPKIIDFGVAKAIDQRLTEHTLTTGFAQLVGTPLYMSPEQAKLSPLGVDTRSDIYSLGVLLYELLTGTTPFDKDRLHSVSYDELRRIIREEEPPRPSARISTLAADLATTFAEHRRTDARRLVQTVHGDLDWIVMKCLEKDRNRRYETPNGLARDIERYLNNEPVLASPPSWTTRLAKWSRRHRAACIAAGLLIFVIAAGSTIAAVLLAQEQSATAHALHESEQKERALQVTNQELEKERKRAEENLRSAREAVDRMLTRVAGDLTDKPHLSNLQRALLEDALEFYQQFLNQDEDDPALRHETAQAYIRVSEIQTALGRVEEAEQAAKSATALLQKLVKEFPADRSYAQDLADAYFAHRSALQWSGKEEKLVLAEQLVSHARTIATQNPSDPSQWEQVAVYETDLGNSYLVAGIDSQVEPHLREGLRILEKLYGDHPELPKNTSRLAHCQTWLGNFLLRMGTLDEAEPLLVSALFLEREMAAAHPDNRIRRGRLAHVLQWTGVLRHLQRKYGEALKLHQESIELYEKLVGDFPDIPNYRTQFASSYQHLANVLWAVERNEDGDDALRRATFHRDIVAKAVPDWMLYQTTAGWTHFELGKRLHMQGLEVDAASEYRRAQDYFEAALKRLPDASGSNRDIAKFLAICPAPQFQDPQRAAKHARRALQIEPQLPGLWKTLGIAHYLSKDWHAAEQAFAKSFESRFDEREAGDFFYRAIIAERLGKREDAREWYKKGVEQWPDRPPPPPWVRHLRDEAEAVLRIATPSNESNDKPSQQHKEPTSGPKSNGSTGTDQSTTDAKPPAAAKDQNEKSPTTND